MPVKLPLKSIYASPLQIRARDTRLGGYLKPIVGVGIIDLSTKIPWCPDTYKPPQSEMFTSNDLPPPKEQAEELGLLPGQNTDPTALKLAEMKNQREGDLLADDFIASPEPPSVDQFIGERTRGEDTGAGVFGALTHIRIEGQKKKSKAEMAFSDPDWSQDDGDKPPEWAIGRLKLPGELEEELKTTPFETYLLTRGKVGGLLGNSLKTVGKLKGLVRVMEHEDDPPMFPQELMDMLLKPKGYKCRLYLLAAKQLAKMDVDFRGRPASSDPYLKVTLGKFVFDDRQNAVDDVTECDLYKVSFFLD